MWKYLAAMFLFRNVGFNLCLFLPDVLADGLEETAYHILMRDLDYTGLSHRNTVTSRY